MRSWWQTEGLTETQALEQFNLAPFQTNILYISVLLGLEERPARRGRRGEGRLEAASATPLLVLQPWLPRRKPDLSSVALVGLTPNINQFLGFPFNYRARIKAAFSSSSRFQRHLLLYTSWQPPSSLSRREKMLCPQCTLPFSYF